MSTKFKYLIKKFDPYADNSYITQVIDNLGADEWELVTAIQSPQGYKEFFFKKTINIVPNTGPR